MNVTQAVVLLGAGLAAGTVNAVAGGGSLVTFPTLLAVGLPPISATVTNSVAVFPGYVASVYGSRTDLRDLAAKRGVRAILGLAPTVVLGTALGCTLLLNTPPRTFDFVVPLLVLGATTVLALHAAAGFGAVYGGYFNAALGVMLVAALGLAIDDLRARVSALKNAISAVVGAGAVLAYAIFGPVDWAAAAVLTPATLLGGYVGARLARRLPSTALRLVIVAFGLVVGVVLLIRALT